MSSRIASAVDVHRTWSTYKYRMETMFQPPFNGSGYFRAGWDDHLKLDITPLDEYGAEAGPTESLFDKGYTG